MNKFKYLLLLMILILIINKPAVADDSYQSMQVNCNGGAKNVSFVTIDLNDPCINIESVFAGQQIGHTDYLQNIAEQLTDSNTEIVAAINAGFFNPVKDDSTKLWSTIQQKGTFVHLGSIGSVIGFGTDKNVAIENLYIVIKGSVNGKWDESNGWSAWGLNHGYTQPEAVAVFTPSFGKTTGSHNRISIVVRNGRIIYTKNGEAPIYDDGYTIVMESNNKMLKRFRKGDAITYKLAYYKSDYSQGLTLDGPINWDAFRVTVGAGPTLLKNGKIIANGRAEGFFESEMIDRSAVLRSFIGVNQKQQLFMGVAQMATVEETAEICLNLGMTQAICLDGGLSSSLYYRGKYVSGPFRKITDAIVITRHKDIGLPGASQIKIKRFLI